MAATAIPVPNSGEVVATSWGAAVAAAHNGIQSGIASIVVTATVRFDYVLVFPRPYSAPPTVIVSPVGFQTTLAGLGAATTNTQATISVFRNDGATLTAGTVVVHWIAIGV